MHYTNIPHCATRLDGENAKFITSIPTSTRPLSRPSTTSPTSPTKQTFNIPNLLLSSTLQLPNTPVTSPRDGARLLSMREPLSLQVTSINFRRFVSKSGPIFWLQDRIEEVVMWRKGGKVTCSWMAIYSLLCIFPRLFLLVPHIILISVLLATHGHRKQALSENPTPQPKEGTVDWYANLQAIQNLMGAVSDLYDATLPLIPTMTWATGHTSQLLTILSVSLVVFVPIAVIVPFRPILLVIGLSPFVITHPLSLRLLPTLLHRYTSALQSQTQRFIDNDNLEERHWFSHKRDVELWESERWTASNGWSKSALKVGERRSWTKGSDGLSDIVINGDGDVRNLTYTLSPGYEFIETEDWRLDREGKWEQHGADECGWVYTDDSWEHPNPAPREEWKAHGITRRRRWTHRIYLTNVTRL